MKFKIQNSKFIITAAIAGLLLLSSCSTKPCRCYLLEKWGSVRVSETYIDPSTPCGELGYSNINPDDSSYRYCTEWDDPEIDTMDVVRMFWGKK
ncbi:MAG: hypothetical protein J6X58_07895 [Bacteroidales bacterium]|nr:hypothetical protein [Bacteroidales bacterium]